jgi:hypothetical protein
MDSFQWEDAQQMLKEKGFNTDKLRIDVNIEPYNRLRMTLYEHRIKRYFHPVGVNELEQLEWNKRKGKVDHRPAVSKDICDSLAGMVHNCETIKISEPVAPSLGEVESSYDEEAMRKQAEMRWLLGQVSREEDSK